MHRYITQGTCSKAIDIELDGDIIKKVKFQAGCAGNLQGIARLVQGMDIHDVIARVRGIKCQNNTSCPDQLAIALSQILEQRGEKSRAEA